VDAPPLVSILLPARNAAGTLPAALQSLVEQSFRDWECIVVDDASADGTAEVAERWAAQDGRVRLVRRARHGGIAAALERAAELARGALLARQDADDMSRPARLAQSVALLRSDARLGAVACRVRQFPEVELPSGMRAYGEWLNGLLTPDDIAREIWVESPLPHPAVVMRREAFECCGGYRETRWPEDYDLWLRMHVAGWRLAKVDALLYDWRHAAGRLTFSDPRYDPAAFLDCKLHHLTPRLQGRHLIVWGAGRDGKRLTRALQAREHHVAAFIDIDPRKVGGTRLGVRVWAPERLPETHAPASESTLLLVAVGTRGARQLIRERLACLGYEELRDFLCLH
jgi:GT2 family glycosyltransferase